MESSSGSWLPKDKVISACEAVIISIKEDRKRRKEELIQREMNKKRWFRRNYTRAEAIKALNVPRDVFSEFSFIEASYGLQEAHAKTLLKLAKASTDVVFVTSEDFSYIASYYE